MVCFGWIGMLPIRPLNPDDKSPLFRQLYEHIKGLIDSGALPKGGRLARHPRIGWPTWTEPDHGFRRLCAAGVRGADHRTRGAGKLCGGDCKSCGRCTGVRQFLALAAFGVAISARRVSQDVRRSDRERRGRIDPATGIACRISGVAALSAGTGASGGRGARIGRHPDYQRLPAGFRSAAKDHRSRRDRADRRSRCIWACAACSNARARG